MFFVNCDLCTPLRSATSLLIPSNNNNNNNIEVSDLVTPRH